MKPLCVVSCPIDTFSGYGARSRDFVKGLIQSKGEEWDIKIAPQRWGSTPFNFLKPDKPEDKALLDRFVLEATRAKSILSAWPIPIAATVDDCIKGLFYFNISSA